MRGVNLFEPVWRALIVGLLVSCGIGCALLRSDMAGDVPADGGRISAISSTLGTSWGLTGFHYPEESEPPRLIQLEPYQPGKIPVVFIHGLASAPGTWKEMIEGLETDPEIRERYQFWAFQYPTGVSFLAPAAELRRQLTESINACNLSGPDPALKHVVLVGHSMGGLVARLQVTDSQEQIWKTFFTRPVEELEADAETREHLQQLMLFEPVPFVERVIYIATPHQGSRLTERPIGLLGRQLVQFPNAVRSKYGNLLRANADKLSGTATADVPTSVDHLKPGNAVLEALEELEPAPHVHVHSIVGTGRLQADFSLGDGVVSTRSSHLDEAETELVISAAHTKVHKQDKAIDEVRRLLHLHLEDLPGKATVGVLHAHDMTSNAGQIKQVGTSATAHVSP